MALVNVNNQAMPMGDDTGRAGDGQTGPKRHFKHIGELADESKAKVVIVYRTVPGESNNCLVVGTKFLPDIYSDHTLGINACLFAASRGAKIIEKHFSLNQSLQCETEKAHVCSMNGDELRILKSYCESLFFLKK